MGILKIVLIGLALVMISCSQLVAPAGKQQSEQQTSFDVVQLGSLTRTDGVEKNLDLLPQSSLVLIFASDTCVTCAREAQYWKSIFLSGLPTNIYFAHIMIGGNISDASDWKDYYSINWDVLIQGNDSLYRKYCAAIITPCFVVLNHQTNKIIQTYQILNRANIEEITGPWTF